MKNLKNIDAVPVTRFNVNRLDDIQMTRAERERAKAHLRSAERAVDFAFNAAAKLQALMAQAVCVARLARRRASLHG